MSLIEIDPQRHVSVNPDEISSMYMDEAYGHPSTLVINFRNGTELRIQSNPNGPRPVVAREAYERLLLAGTMCVKADPSLYGQPVTVSMENAAKAFRNFPDKPIDQLK